MARVDGREAGAKSVDGREAGAKSVDGREAGAKSVDGREAGAKSVDGREAGAKSVDGREAGAKSVDGREAGAESADSLVQAWCARDHARALLPEDHAAIDATVAARTFVMERILAEPRVSAGGHADLFHGCLVLGRLLAAHGASPTLAAATIAGAIEVAHATGEWITSARAALAEGYGAARLDRARAEAVSAWDYPRCAVRIDKETTAFAAGVPDEDDEALRDWAARVAIAAQKDKVRRAILGGTKRAREALADALGFLGIEVVREWRTPSSMLRWLWRRARAGD